MDGESDTVPALPGPPPNPIASVRLEIRWLLTRITAPTAQIYCGRSQDRYQASAPESSPLSVYTSPPLTICAPIVGTWGISRPSCMTWMTATRRTSTR